MTERDVRYRPWTDTDWRRMDFEDVAFGDGRREPLHTALHLLPEDALIAEFHRAGIFLPDERMARRMFSL